MLPTLHVTRMSSQQTTRTISAPRSYLAHLSDTHLNTLPHFKPESFFQHGGESISRQPPRVPRQSCSSCIVEVLKPAISSSTC